MEKQEEETMEACIARMKEANPDLTDEAAQAMCEQQKKPAQVAEGEEKGKPQKKPEDMTFIDKIHSVVDELIDNKIRGLEAQIEKRIASAVTDKENQVVEGLKKKWGLTEDRPIYLSEFEALFRKMLLEHTDPGKKTVTLTKEKPEEGKDDAKIKPASKMFDDLMKNRGTM